MAILMLYFSILLSTVAFGRPATQRITINDHQWEVPDEQGWEDVVREASDVQEAILTNCRTTTECRMIIDAIRAVFLKHPVSKKFLDTSQHSLIDDSSSSIFKWG